jgi:Replication-relaxation
MNRDSQTKRKRFSLAHGDMPVLKAVYEFRFLRRDHLSALMERPAKSLHRRLIGLVDSGYLRVTRLPQQKHIYSLGREGISVLIAEGVIKDGSAFRRIRTSELKELFLKHEMMIVDQHVVLRLAERVGEFRLVHWEEGRGLFDSVIATDHRGSTKLPVRPDAFFTIEDGRRDEAKNRFHFFLEIDRSTMPHTAFREKLKAYRHYREQGLHAKKLKINSFRVLTVTMTAARARNLRDLAGAMLPEGARKHFLFTAMDNYSLGSPKRVFGDIYFSARDHGQDVMYPLVPEPESSLKRTA